MSSPRHPTLAEDRLHIPAQPLQDTLLRRLGAIEASHLPSGRLHYGAPGSAADDLAMAFTLAIQPKRRGTARFRWPDGYLQETSGGTRGDFDVSGDPSARDAAVPPSTANAETWDVCLAFKNIPAGDRTGLDLAGLKALAKARNLI